MEAVVRVKRSLRRPIRKLTCCVSGVKERRLCAKPRYKRRGGGGEKGARGGGVRETGRNSQLRATSPRDPSAIHSYRADLEKERKQREAMNAQKNAERAALRAHFRRKYQLSEDPKDINHLRSVEGKVSLPHQLSKIIYPEAKTKDEGFQLLRAFQGLSLDSVLLTGSGKPSRTSTAAAAAGGDSCRVM